LTVTRRTRSCSSRTLLKRVPIQRRCLPRRAKASGLPPSVTDVNRHAPRLDKHQIVTQVAQRHLRILRKKPTRRVIDAAPPPPCHSFGGGIDAGAGLHLDQSDQPSAAGDDVDLSHRYL